MFCKVWHKELNTVVDGDSFQTIVYACLFAHIVFVELLNLCL